MVYYSNRGRCLKGDTIVEDYEPSDYEYVVSALAYANVEGFGIEDLLFAAEEASNGKEFDAAVVSMIELKELSRGAYESFRAGQKGFLKGSEEGKGEDSTDH